MTWKLPGPNRHQGLDGGCSELGNIQLDDSTNTEYFPYIEPVVTLGEALSFLRTANKPLHEVCSQDRNRVHKAFLPMGEYRQGDAQHDCDS